MEYTAPGGSVVELPKLTVALARKMNAHRQAGGPEEAWRAEYAFLREALPADVLAEELDGGSFEEVDLSALDALFAGVAGTYGAPALEAQAERYRAALSAIDSTQLERLSGLVQAVERMQQMQQPRKGFRVVK